MNRKANLFRLYPTPEQNAQMVQIAGTCRFVCNLALAILRRVDGALKPVEGHRAQLPVEAGTNLELAA